MVIPACANYGYWSDQSTTACFDTYNASSPIFTDISVNNTIDRQWQWFLCNEPLFYWQEYVTTYLRLYLAYWYSFSPVAHHLVSPVLCLAPSTPSTGRDNALSTSPKWTVSPLVAPKARPKQRLTPGQRVGLWPIQPGWFGPMGMFMIPMFHDFHVDWSW